LLDVIVRLDEPIADDTDTYGRTRVGAGGQAANVAAWVAALGGRARFIGKRASDPVGRLVAEELTQRGVMVVGPEVARGTGTVVSVTLPDGTRTMLSDRGVAPTFAPSELDDDWLRGCETLHVPGYSLVREPLGATARAAAELAPRVTLDLSSTRAIESLGGERFREQVGRLSPSVVFATQAEADLVGALDVETLVLKRGAEGCVVRRGDEEERYPARPADVVDSTGAGDAFAAGFLLGGPELALDSAARCVSTMGAMPPWP
jgi:sugar/nucleoside kinase (ribokinase family)